MEANIKYIKKKLKFELDSFRYEHTLGVMYTAATLAMKYGYNINKAMLAGLLHDCAKCIPYKKAVKMCEKNNIKISVIDKETPLLIHAKLGAFLASDKYKIDDNEIISAIYNHTTGKPDMNLLEKIIFIADYIEPHRNKAKNLKEIRECAFTDLDKALALILRDTLSYLNMKSGAIDPTTKITYDYYKKYL